MRGALAAVIAVVSVCLGPIPLCGQSRSAFDVEVGPGFANGSGAENPAPSLPTASFGAGFWLTNRWGLAAVHVRSIGEDRFDPPIDAPDRVFAGKEALRYTRVVARYRKPIGPGDIVAGVGLVLGASYAYIDYLKTPSGLQRLGGRASWGGVGLEMYFNRRVSRYVGFRAGVTLDTGTETTVVQPVLLGIVTF